jgi:hypothetical protein
MSTLTVPASVVDLESPAECLRRRAAAVRIHFTWWGVHRTLTAQQKEEVGDTCGADARFLTAGKKIIDVRHASFRRLTAIRTRIVGFWRGLTLPFVEPGIRLIRQSDIAAFVETMDRLRAGLAEAETELNAAYHTMKSDARDRLGKLYDPADYPPLIRGLFRVEWDFPSVEPPSYLMRLNPDVYRQEQQRVAERFQEAVQLAEQAFATEFARLLSHLSERLSNDATGERRVFRDSVVANLTEFFERFRKLNISSSPDLDRLVDDAQQMVKGVTPQQLRNNDALRQQIATQISRVESQLAPLIVDRPRRQLLRSSPAPKGASHAIAR